MSVHWLKLQCTQIIERTDISEEEMEEFGWTADREMLHGLMRNARWWKSIVWSRYDGPKWFIGTACPRAKTTAGSWMPRSGNFKLFHFNIIWKSFKDPSHTHDIMEQYKWWKGIQTLACGHLLEEKNLFQSSSSKKSWGGMKRGKKKWEKLTKNNAFSDLFSQR